MYRPMLEPLDCFVARVPVLAVDAVASMQADGLASNASLRYAVLVASPSLHEATAGGDPSRPINAGAARSTRHYAARMSLRPTPFGAFAGIALAEWGTHTTLSLSADFVRTRTRLDMGWLLAVVEELESRREIFHQLRVRTNPSAIPLGGRVVLCEQSGLGASDGNVRRVSVRATRVVRTVLELARSPVAVRQLLDHIHSLLPAAPADLIENALESLRASSLLLTELRPPVTHGQPMTWLTDVLRSLHGVQDELNQLEEIRACLVPCDAHGGAERAERAVKQAAAEARRVVSEMIRDRPLPSITPLQIDTVVRLDGIHLPRAIGLEAALAAEALLRCAPVPGTGTLASRLTREIQTRYGEWEFVSVRELIADGVLDRLVETSRVDEQSYRAQSVTVQSRRNALLTRLATDAMRHGAWIVELDDATLDELSQPIEAIRAPSTMEIFVSLAANSEQDVDEGRFSLVVGPGIGSAEAGRSLGRFVDMLAPHDRDRVHAIWESGRATSGGCVHVELACLPRDPRLANVALRVRQAPHELSVGTWPGVPEERVVALHEVEVGAPGGQLQLRWARTGQRIRLTQATMLNPLWTPAICQVLLAASAPEETRLAPFDWGPASGFAALPRVVRGRSVLRTAEWRLDPNLLLQAADRSAADVRHWLDEQGMPERVCIAQGDIRLLVDLTVQESVQDLVVEARALARQGGQLTLHEALPSPGDAWLAGPDGKHALELAVQLAVSSRQSDQPAPADDVRMPAAVSHLIPCRPRRVWPGEDWAYVKLYADRERQVELLLGELQPFVAELSEDAVLASWFFIRYADPDHHIRIRLKTRVPGGGPALLSRLASRVARIARTVGLQHVSFEPYVRELQRYGGDEGMDLAERVFHADSEATLRLLSAVHSAAHLDPIAVGVMSCCRLLTDLGVRTSRMRSWLPETADGHPDTGRAHRVRQSEIRALLTGSAPTPAWEGVIAALDRRSNALEPALGAIRQAAGEGRLSVEPEVLARSHVHLHLNRIFGPDPNSERLTLGLLRRALRSREAAGLAQPGGGD